LTSKQHNLSVGIGLKELGGTGGRTAEMFEILRRD